MNVPFTTVVLLLSRTSRDDQLVLASSGQGWISYSDAVTTLRIHRAAEGWSRSAEGDAAGFNAWGQHIDRRNGVALTRFVVSPALITPSKLLPLHLEPGGVGPAARMLSDSPYRLCRALLPPATGKHDASADLRIAFVRTGERR